MHIYAYAPNTLTYTKTLELHKVAVNSMTMSQDYLASADQGGKIVVVELAGLAIKISSQWCWHTAKVLSMDWHGEFLVSGGLDTHVYVWSLSKPTKKIAIKVGSCLIYLFEWRCGRDER